MISKSPKNEQFIQEYIPRVSRTFALTIKFLPRGFRDSVYTSYLLCRVADTLEDSPHLEPDEKKRRLTDLENILLNAGEGQGLNQNKIASLYDSIKPEHGDDHRLLYESARLFEILESLPASHKKIIYRWVAEMAGGMARYSQMIDPGGGKIVALENVEQWDNYCYYVAGTVGNMLTDLFIEQYRFDDTVAGKLRKLGKSFGLGLQKVNVIKDVPDDRERNVCYLPEDILIKHGLSPASLANEGSKNNIENAVAELARLTVVHFDDALDYFARFPRHLKGVRMFLIVPVYLAVETISLINKNPVQTMTGPPVKLRRGGVTRLVSAAAIRIGSNNAINEYYKKLRIRAVSK